MRPNLIIFNIIVLVLFSLFSCERKSGRKNTQGLTQNHHDEQSRYKTFDSKGKTLLKIEKINGVYEIPTEIDDIPIHFIFDTGAGL